MQKWFVMIAVEAFTTVAVMADSEEEAKDLAISKVDHPRVCHQCSQDLDVGDPIEAIEAWTDD
jgi:hypothetical protein